MKGQTGKSIARRRNRRGAALVEFALLAPIMVLLFAMCLDFARVYYYSQVLCNCARQGALYASNPLATYQSPYANVTAAALADATNLTTQPTVVSTSGTDSAGHACVTVTVSWTFNTILDYPGIGASFGLTRSVEMRIQEAPSD